MVCGESVNEGTESRRVHNGGSYRSLLAVLHHPVLFIILQTAPQKTNGLQAAMREESMVQIRLLN